MLSVSVDIASRLSDAVGTVKTALAAVSAGASDSEVAAIVALVTAPLDTSIVELASTLSAAEAANINWALAHR